MKADSGHLRGALDELEARLADFGAPIVAAFQPGTDERRIRESLEAEGLAPHDDLVTWWGWHDGVNPSTAPPNEGPFIHLRPETTLLSPWHLLSLDEALRLRRWLGEVHWGTPIEQGFLRSWIPILTTDGAGELCAATGVDGPPSLHIVDEGYFGTEPPRFASLGELVDCMVGVFDEGLVAPWPLDPRLPWLDLATLTGLQRRLVVW